MKTFIIVMLTIFAASSSVFAFDRLSFVEQLSEESCAAAPEQIFIDTTTENFDLANAMSLSWVALQTLDDDPNSIDSDADLTRLKDQWHLSNIKLIENSRWKVRAMIADYNGTVFLTFRHTNSNLNWLLNVDLGLWHFDHSFTMGEKVHHGFGTMLGSVWEEIIAELNLRTQNNQKVYVFGHSLGGALSLLAAPGLKMEGIDVAQVYATGSPKVGSVAWASAASQVMGESSVFRLTNGNDLFSRIPVGESSLDEFRELFYFVPSIITRLLDRLRYRMPFGLFGDHVTMADNGQLVITAPLSNDLEEQAYWQGIADEFRLIDDSSNNVIKNVQKKIGIITNNLDAHLMRQDNGYSCKMVQLLKAGL